MKLTIVISNVYFWDYLIYIFFKQEQRTKMVSLQETGR